MNNKSQTQCQKGQTFSSFLKQKLMNISYVVKNNNYIYVPTFSRKTITIENGYESAYLLGCKYDYPTKELFLQKFQNTIWFSYQKSNDQGDVGWGCMIRVVQMLFAQVFKRYFKKLTLSQIIELFKQQNNGPFSLPKVCQAGLISKRFTSGPQIYSVFMTLLKNQRQKYKLNFTPYLICYQVQIKSEQCYSQQQFPKIISINAKIGQKDTIQQDFVHHLIHLMKDQRFCGLVSGVGNQALFVIGEYQNSAIILDPHYVQKQSESQYFQKTPKGVQFTKLKSGVIINFYIQNLSSFGQWVDYLIMMNRAWCPYTSFNLKVQNQEQWSKNYRKKSQDFQLLI